MDKLFVVGDIHGQYEKLVCLLQSRQLVDRQLRWIAGEATLCFTGDFVDRGPNGIGCIDLVMNLQQQAEAVGGRVVALLGNHEVMLLAAHRFENDLFDCISATFWELWHHNGGMMRDFERLHPAHIGWLSALPAMTQIDDYLLMHSDTIRYADFGEEIELINQRIATVLESDCAWAWVQLLQAIGQREDFVYKDAKGEDANGVAKAKAMLEQYGGKQIVHGHTPIPCVTDQLAHNVNQPFVYADGLCINIDGGMYMGSAGFICELTTSRQPEVNEGQYILQLPEQFVLEFPELLFVER